MRISHTIQAAALGMAFLATNGAHATACPSGITCDNIAVQLTTSQLGDGTWQYDYTFSRTHYPYNGGTAPVTPISKATPLIDLRLPYFGDAGIGNLKVGSDYADVLTASIVDTPFGGASQSILVSAAPGQPVEVKRPDTVVSGVNSLLSFTSSYAPDTYGQVAMMAINYSDWRPSDPLVIKLTSEQVPQGADYYGRLAPVKVPGSPLAVASSVPETGTWLMLATGLLMLAGLQRRRR